MHHPHTKSHSLTNQVTSKPKLPHLRQVASNDSPSSPPAAAMVQAPSL